MLKMGFTKKRVSWIMLCVESRNNAKRVNSKLKGPIIPGKGLR